jgi:uncharacterized protein (TIGR00251 family)
VRVQPRSSRNKVAGLFGDAIKINLTAPPVANAANKALVVFLSRQLSVTRSSVTILSGHTGRNKQVMVMCKETGDRRDAIRQILAGWVEN